MRNRPGCQRHTSGRAGERGRGAGSAAQGWDQPGHPDIPRRGIPHPTARHPTPHGPASPHPAVRRLRTLHSSATLCPRSRHPWHPPASPAPSGTLRHLLTPPPHGALGPRNPRPAARLPRAPICAPAHTLCSPPRRFRPPAHTRAPSRAAQATRPGAATAVAELDRFVQSLRSSVLSLGRRRQRTRESTQCSPASSPPHPG